MKKNIIDRKLVLNRKTVSNLEDREMKDAKAGGVSYRVCGTYDVATCVSEWAYCNTNEHCSCVGVTCM
jgi:hypothetical protein